MIVGIVIALCIGTVVQQSGAAPCNEVRCMMNPCDQAACPAYAADALCTPNYCGGCNAKWILNGLDVTESCETGNGNSQAASASSKGDQSSSSAQGGSQTALNKGRVSKTLVSLPQQLQQERPCERVRCFMDPCTVTACPAYTAALCRASYCNGCFAQWSLNGNDVTDTCIKSMLDARARGQGQVVSSVTNKEETRGKNRKGRGRFQRPRLTPFNFWSSFTSRDPQRNPFARFWQ